MTAFGTDEPAEWHFNMLRSLPHKSDNAVITHEDAKLNQGCFDRMRRRVFTSQDCVLTRGLENSGSGK